MSNQDEFENFVETWRSEYGAEGADKRELIKFLKAYPDACIYLIDEIIQHLENPSKRYLGKRSDVTLQMLHQKIYGEFIHGPDHIPFYDPDGSANESNIEWVKKSYDQKLYDLGKLYPNYTRQYLEKIISLNKKQ